MILTPFTYATPATLDEAVALLAGTPGSRALAGGQSLLVDLQKGAAQVPLLVDLRKLPGLGEVAAAPDGGLRVGALTTLTALVDDPRIRERYPALAQAADATGDPQVRNRGTVGGTLSAAGSPTDLPAAAIAVGGEVTVADASGTRRLTAEQYAAQVDTDRATELVVTCLELPAPSPGRSAFEKIAVRATRYPLCAVAVHADHGQGAVLASVRIAATGSVPHPARLPALEQALAGTRPTLATVRAAVRALPADTFVPRPGVSREYLAHLTAVLTDRALRNAATPG